MNQVDIIKWNKGYYVIKKMGHTSRREWVKTKKAAEALKSQWMAE